MEKIWVSEKRLLVILRCGDKLEKGEVATLDVIYQVLVNKLV